MKKKRTYNTRLIRSGRSYTIQGIAELFDVHINAVDRWVEAGLVCIDDKKPRRVHGSALVDFLKARQSDRKKACNPHEIYCCKCRKTQAVWENAIDLIIRNAKQLNIAGLCAVCGAKTFKAGSLKSLSEYQKLFRVQTVQGEHIRACDNPPVMCGIEGESRA